MNAERRRSKINPILAILLVFVLVLSACSGGKANEPNKEGNSEPENNQSSADKRDVGGLQLPISDKKLDLSLWSPSGGNFRGKDFNEKLSFQKMEENTNVHINFQHATEASAEAFSLLMSSGQLPDMIFHEAWDKEASKYGLQGALLPLEDLIDQHAPNIKKILDEHPDIRGQITSPDGHIFYLPNMVLESDELTQMFPQVRQDWVEKLGLEMPETVDDWYNMLKAFREQDVNGNSKQDEIPLVTVSVKNVMMLFAPAYGVEYDFFVEDGKVKYGPYDPRFKEVIAFLNKLYEEKLLDTNYLVDTTFQSLTEKVTTDLAGAWFGWSGSYMGNFTTLMEGKHDTFKIAPVIPPKGPNGDQRHVSFRWPAAGIGLAVSAKTKHPEEVIKWLDYQYSEEGIILNNFGVEGKSYDLVNGDPIYKKEVTHPEDGLTNTQALLNHTVGGGSWATVADPRYAEQIRQANGQTENPLELYGKYIDFDSKLPPIQFTTEENDVVVSAMADITTYVDETINGMIMGRIPVDSYDNVIGQLQKMQIEKVLEKYQSAYDRFKGK
ncbi:extracellular solute-binding protein [Paenibacillus sp. J2TS4]|uniref:extracellular solute-binding protein n=1 Tax=Paenibacillus sp. J2TS4 TaxID=2807194 RepID=UPI001B17221C|nr:extracellular solute-binding protein [Paenibacillus sp. J2TS4]GIP33404.1 sugar ABC transporter permease [Paenibacillus sp. J2TS4]